MSGYNGKPARSARLVASLRVTHETRSGFNTWLAALRRAQVVSGQFRHFMTDMYYEVQWPRES